MMSRTIVMETVTYTYPNADEPALENVDLEIKRGEFVLIVGRSGCGKSTLARCLNGLIPHFFEGNLEGKVIVEGKDVREHSVYELAKHVGMVFQNPESQLFTIAVENEVAFGPENFGVPKEDLRKRVNWALECVKMSELRLKPVFELSDGQKQRVAVASNLSMLPNILVLDEPTSNLDPKGSQEVFDILKDLKEKTDKTIVLIEHRTKFASKYADRVIIMDSGEIKYDDSPEILFKHQILENFGIRSPEIKLSPLSSPKLKEEPFDPVIEVKNLHYSYESGFSIQGVNMSVQKGESIGIMGPNGSGKTTLIKHFVGLLKPIKGKVFVCGIDTQNAKVSKLAEKVALILQNPNHQLFMNTVYDEVAVSLRTERLSKEEIEKRVEKVLKIMDLWELKDRHPHSLSEGQKQRLTIASALVKEPNVLVLDEPTSGMDGHHLNLLIDKLNELKRKGLTLILVSHDLEVISKVCDRTVLLDNGGIIADRPIEETLIDKDL